MPEFPIRGVCRRWYILFELHAAAACCFSERRARPLALLGYLQNLIGVLQSLTNNVYVMIILSF